MFTAMKVPRQCPLVLSVKVRSREGKALGIGEGGVLRSGLFCCAQRNEIEQGSYCIRSEF
jgi:hypothetical protein